MSRILKAANVSAQAMQLEARLVPDCIAEFLCRCWARYKFRGRTLGGTELPMRGRQGEPTNNSLGVIKRVGAEE